MLLRCSPTTESSPAETQALVRRVSNPSYPATPEAIDVVVVADDQPWLLALAAPLAKKMAQGDPLPLLLTASATAKPEVQLLLERAQARSALVLGFPPGPQWVLGLSRSTSELVPRDSQPLEASLRVAKRFWGTSREVVLATLADPESVILGSVLATHRGVPLLVAQKAESGTAVAGALEELHVQKVIVASGQPRWTPTWTGKLAAQTEVLDETSIQRRVVAELQAPGIRNVILGRAPRGKKTGQAAWLAPYVSAVRGAPVVLCRSSSAAEAEAKVRELIERERLRPIPLDGLPVVILQSCDSLQEGVLRQVHESGGVAMIGTSTPVHSTSGSALVKAVADGLLYRGDTLGEALCDARNYFACLQDIKDLRGHTQQAKSQRVAMSFRLWGDPELRVFAQGPGTPQKPPVAAHWEGEARLVITVPGGRLPEARNEEYVVEMFPGSEAAGMVQRVKGQSARRLTPLYFFKVPLPDGFADRGYTAIEDPRATRPRAVFRVDPMERFLYVLYYPAGEKPNRAHVLRLVTRSGRPVP